jgi:hypothetical protein
MKTLNDNFQLEADFLRKLRISFLKKEGYLDSPKTGVIEWHKDDEVSSVGIESHVDDYHPYIRLLYSQTDDKGNKQYFDYKITLHRTPCSYGGWRFWFLCPLRAKSGLPCGKVSAVLYKAGDYFGCRRCYNLTYQCRKHNANSSLAYWFRSRKAMKKIEKLELEIKRTEYAGKSTSKQLQLNQAYNEIEGNLREFSKSRILSVYK